jgi:hypothetical protein
LVTVTVRVPRVLPTSAAVMLTVMVEAVTVGTLVVLTPFHWTVAPVTKLAPVLLIVKGTAVLVGPDPGLMLAMAGAGLLTVKGI